jgi:hypothetical protein
LPEVSSHRAGLLTFAPMQAWAACAWVLWDGNPLASPGLDMIWSISGTYQSLQECNRDLAATVRVMKQRGTDVTSPMSGTSLYRNGEVRGYLHCLPDTVDPRGPKGK